MTPATDIITRLIGYAGHDYTCDATTWPFKGACTCGYSAAIADAREFMKWQHEEKESGVKQYTVKRAVEAWNWIHNNEHHIVGTDYSKTRLDDDGHPLRIAMYFQNYHEKMRVPERLCSEVFAQIRPNKRKFDSRMFALRPKARDAVTP